MWYNRHTTKGGNIIMEEKEKDSYIRIRIDTQTKERFQRVCKTKAINSSELIRQLINNWTDEQEAKDKKRRKESA